MGRPRKREPAYAAGPWTLRWHGKEAIAERGKGDDRERIKLGVRSPTKKPPAAVAQQARDALDAHAERHKAVLVQSERHTIGSIWTMWLAERERDGLSNEIKNQRWKALGPHFANKDPMLLEPEDCREYARARFALGRKPWTVHSELVDIRTCTKWAADNHKIERRPKIWVPRAGEPRDRVLTYEEAQRLVAAAAAGDPHVYLFVRVLFATAARHMAILDLTWDRVDFDANTIEFDEDLPPDPMSKAWRKGRAKVVMGPALRTALETAKKGRRCDHVIEHGGRRLVTVKNGFFSAVKRAGLAWQEPHPDKPGEMVWTTDVTPHVGRHTVLTWLAEGKIDDKRRAQLAGHKDEHTTRQVYTHLDASVLREAVELLEERLLAKPEITSDPARVEKGDE